MQINTVICISGFISPILVSFLTYENQTVHQWKIVFLITGSILLISGMIYMIFSDANVQYWNKYGIDDELENDDLDGNNLALLKGEKSELDKDKEILNKTKESSEFDSKRP